MKKFVTLVLALVMALAIALPAMAFTSDTTEASTASPYEVDVYLVEYDNDEFFGITSMPPSDRGYAKNEIVAAVVELFVPKDKDPYDSGYRSIDVYGENVTFAVNETGTKTANAPALVAKTTAADGWKYTLVDNALNGKNTFKWLVFAKVTGDDASISVDLVDGAGNTGFSSNSLTVVLAGDSYTVAKSFNTTTGGNYAVTSTEGNFKVFVDKNYKSTGLSVSTPTTPSSFYALGFTVGGQLGVVDTDGVVKTSGTLYDNIMDVYTDVVKGVFGLDYMLIGNYVRDSFWTGLTSGDTLTATVEIKPWTAYVTVPDNIVVDPPKTGDAASIVGFVMIVLAAAAVVAVKKVRA